MPVSLCVLRIEIDEDLPEMEDNPAEVEAAKEQKKRDRGARESKTITVETYASVLSGPTTEIGILPTSSRRTPPKTSTTEEAETISFFCGNPLLEVTKGVLHLYKENELRETQEAKMLCLLSIPAALGAHELLAFAAACHQDIAHVRVLRDGSPDHYMALLTFRTCAGAREFHAALDGAAYSSLEPGAVCRMAWVARAEWALAGAAPAAHTELPTCPVCLERMDESVAGVLSVQCAHAFHADCLARWRSPRCPVCRCGQVPEPRAAPVCLHCQQERAAAGGGAAPEAGWEPGEGLLEAEAGSLWICLICGHIGCGRYEKGHAAKHFLATNHTYALQIGSNRVWDYAGDNFVHRLVQNKADGKLVAAGGGGGGAPEGDGQDKLDAAQIEFTYLLTQQLDSQRMYYQGKIDKLSVEHSSQCSALGERAAAAEAEAAALRDQLLALRKENHALDRKLHQLSAKLQAAQTELAEERGLGRALAAAQAQWQHAARDKEEAFVKEISELKEQLRDVMFFVEARGQLQASALAEEELASAQVSVAEPPPQPHGRRRRR